MRKISKLSGMILCLVMFCIMFVISPTPNVFGANSQSSTDWSDYATVDTAPGADGYGTNAVAPRGKLKAKAVPEGKIWFSIRGTGTMTVTLYFQCPGDATWTEYAAYTDNERKVVESGAKGVLWKALVDNGDHTSGSKSFGFDW